jgi:hypothetical protein
MTIKQSKQWQKRRVKKRKRRAKRLQKKGKKKMSDAARLYRIILKHILDLMPPEMLAENCITLAMIITGMLRGKSGQFRKIANEVQYDYKKESLIDRFRRWVSNKNIEVEVAYAPFNTKILEASGQGPIVLMVDSTKMGGQCINLMLSIYYKSRALPFAWVTYKGKKGHSSQQSQLELFKRVKELLPANRPVIILGDGEFDGSEVVDYFINEANWQYVCRTDKSNKIFYQDKWIALHEIPLEAGEEDFWKDVRFTETNNVGPVNILVVWNEAKKEHCFFVTNFNSATEARDYYTFRFTIETLFSDLKSRGFNLHHTRLWHPERLNRLIFAAAIAYFFIISLGVTSIISASFRQLVRSDAFYHSLFQLGLFFLAHILNELLAFPSLIDLPPPDTFEHIVLS